MLEPLLVPSFSRLDEYAGNWAIELNWFANLWRSWQRGDLQAHVAAAGPQKLGPSTVMMPARGGSNIAVIRAEGMLMKQQPSIGGTSTVQMRRDIRAAKADPSVSAILLAIDSPGGSVAGTQALADDVKAARRVKPVWAQIEDMGASAAYWLASQCDAVYASNGTTLVGSIGTLITIYDTSKQAEQQGVRTLVFRTGPLKGAGTDGDPVTEDQAANYQQLANALQSYFDAGVSSGRSLTANQLAAVKSGAVFTAAEAMDKKLIDGIRPLEKTLEALASAK